MFVMQEKKRLPTLNSLCQNREWPIILRFPTHPRKRKSAIPLSSPPSACPPQVLEKLFSSLYRRLDGLGLKIAR